MTAPPEAVGIVEFWYGKIESVKDEIPKDKIKKWYMGGKEYDDLIRSKYEPMMKEALEQKASKFESWKSNEIGCLALILMADQFTRNIYRGSPKAFAYDEYAQQLCLHGIRLGIDIKLLHLHPRYTYFFFHPLLHAENLELQQLFQCKQKEYYAILDAKEDTKHKKHFEGNGLKYLQYMKDFGRFPHRNQILGRKSTPEELRAIGNQKYDPTGATKNTVTAEQEEKKSVDTPTVLIIYHSIWGHQRTMAEEIAKGVTESGCAAKIMQAPETLSDEVIEKMHGKKQKDFADQHAILTRDKLDEMKNADGILFGISSRFGMMSAQMKTLFDSTGQMWQSGDLMGKPAGVFSTTNTLGGGQESTALTAITNFTHHGMVFVPIGYGCKKLFDVSEAHGGSPYGAGALGGQRAVSDLEKEIAVYQGKYFGGFVTKLVKGSK